MRVALIHGAATTARVWRYVLPHLPDDWDVVAPDRPATGDLDREIEYLSPLCAHRTVVGVSGGATLGLELVSRGVPVTAAVLHEPAVGSLAPGLLANVGEGLTARGVAGFGQALYGPAWTTAENDADLSVVQAEFDMFRRFEPSAPASRSGDLVVISTGSASAPARRRSVTRLCAEFGLRQTVLQGCSHAAHLEAPQRLATLIRSVADTC